ncbi:MAG: alanine racemase [Parcubacteria group bacterium CG10_big_fil_rev_8_21_14_0_10_36_14]|nr:MAG: alanine racemase [Parcubacteria group bacterium CG10_big_fil_rev_8_21_14_0_10_36_14]
MKTWIEISKKNILHNIKALKSLLKSPPDPLSQRGRKPLFMAVLKSNAYGHGLREMNTICIQSKLVDWCGVDSFDEAMFLRKQKNRMPILVLGYVPFDRIGECIKNNVSIVAYNNELLKYLEKDSGKYNANFKNKKLKIHIKVETGTSRQGIANEELINFVKKANKNKNIFIEGIYTHYANIEDTTDPSYAMEQLKKFHKNIKSIESLGIHIPIKHSACSAAIINYPETHFDMVRAGISLYGHWSSHEAEAIAKQKNVNLTLKPALTWKTRIAQIKNLSAKTPVSYGLTERVKRNSRIGIIPIGYWDGYDRGLSSIGETLVSGKRAKVLGRVCMNMTIIDITDTPPKVKLFDEVILLGNEITAEELAKKIDTINYEVMTRINPLIKRVIV